MDGFGVMQAGEFEVYTLSGAHITFGVPNDPSHEMLTELDDFREQAGQAPVSYIVAEIDNRVGSEIIKLPAIYVYDEEGNEYEFMSVLHSLDEWGPEAGAEGEYQLLDGAPISEDEYWDIFDQISDFQNELDQNISEAQKGQTVLVYNGEELPDKFTRVSTLPYGIGETEDAYPVE